ncbi:transcriptional regulatory protein YpdB [Kordia sp. SMS9]|uniref:LytR/AlgR family response regulator transcription factor n=1 Tax=Kordia sp. SMS9 TaxID=2282170 RepID=UPI000E0DFA0B|nr:response regulator transcription factor [Kordia sp. SMS9]AXG68424.1 transcriptional regulatory protein YpdB [Kordia sp. SMS9]
MDQINILIVEDTPAQSTRLTKVLQENGYHVVGIATTFKEALTLFYGDVKIDIAIIDIFLEGVPDGIAFAETINTVPNAAKPFVFLTSSTDRQIFQRAKLTQPFSYLMKPFNELEILYAIEMAVEKFYAQQNVFLSKKENTVITDDHLFIKKGKSLKKVGLSDIVYIEVEEKYCNIITEKEKFVIMISLTKISKLLSPSIFTKTHRNFIVNSKKIEEIIPADNLIMLSSNHHVPLSEKYKTIIKNLHTLK